LLTTCTANSTSRNSSFPATQTTHPPWWIGASCGTI